MVWTIIEKLTDYVRKGISRLAGNFSTSMNGASQRGGMEGVCVSLTANQRTCLLLLVVAVVSYYLIMDITLYHRLQAVDLVTEKKVPGQSWSPFHPLSVKLILQDPTTHYVLTPMSEYFNEITHFSEVFYFISPNMITFTHLFLAFVSMRFIVSDSLTSRRIGCLIYEVRSFLDAFDGTVYRAHAANKNYMSHHSELGFWIDSTSDTIGGAALMFGVVFCLWWKHQPRKEINPLPWTTDDKNANLIDHSCEKHDTRTFKHYSKKFIFWRCFCYGSLIGLSSAVWDQTMWSYTDVFMANMKTPELVKLQSEALHSSTTSLLFWSWRMLEGQALVHYILLAIITDKIWEFLRFVQYLGFVVLGLLTFSSYYHLSQLKHLLQLVPVEIPSPAVFGS
ncbi:ceramide phosphoethanolamine synthase-like isoform X2 [Mya arenaria]|uniref:ceramide phosphoethanolamine synthase-like isoform X2 n=1 Tax=Mya arenaria TaxID=6604 RepID=UPI0022E84040|nr:ceramide phosphoethanolamine synthase-like isoform X2 [Mya arenaria]